MAASSNVIGLNDETNASIPTIIAAEMLGYLKANTVATRLVARDWDDDVAQAGQSVQIPFTGSLSVNDKSSDSTVTNQVPDDSSKTVTLDKHKEVTFVVEDVAEMFTRPSLLDSYAADAVAVLVEQMDTDILALYSGFSQTLDATAGLGEDDFREARRQLNAAKAPISNRFALLHEDAEYEALGIERIVNRDYAESLGQMAADSFVGRFGGFNIFMNQLVTIASTQAKNLFAHRNAIAMASRPLAQAGPGLGVAQSVMDEDGIGLRVTLSYDTGYLGPKISIDVLYGVAELRDNHGVVVSTSEI